VQLLGAKLIQCQAAFSASELEKCKLASLEQHAKDLSAELNQKGQERAMAVQRKCDSVSMHGNSGLRCSCF
jgi:hypothetical protein